ncbi:hypothetical protein [Roseibacillus persicicus]|uniref:hypothetical protein n=1 Tax=Roseibacillus persicicus TaxID=454148 RepID=UPI00280D964B|nr:hypothetical protein [Roseibacillus persicicus]MDQ8190228.1 hypothetical protein [Roseibacillus persicicus]
MRDNIQTIAAGGNFTVPPKLQAMSGSLLEPIAELLRATPDTHIRTAVATSFVFSLWQTMSRGNTPRYPSLLLIREDTKLDDPVDSLIKALVTNPSAWEPRIQERGPFAFGTPESAPIRMRQLVENRKKLGRATPINQDQVKQLEATFFAAQQTGFGTGRYRRYSQSWQKDLGFLSNPDGGLILRLESDEDRKQLKQHLHGLEPVLERGEGIGSGLAMQAKAIAFSGSLGLADWGPISAARLASLSRPVLCLPHFGKDPIRPANFPSLEYLHTVWGSSNSSINKVSDPALTPSSPLAQLYLKALRHRLIHMDATYDYSIQRLVRELYSVCLEISKVAACNESKPSEGKAEAILWDLYHNTLRGIAISVEALTWHRIGFPPTNIDADFNKVLTLLRKNKPLSPRDIQRKGRLSDASYRDRILARLESESLIKVEGKSVQATTFTDFTKALYQNPKFPAPPSCWQLLQQKQRAAE